MPKRSFNPAAGQKVTLPEEFWRDLGGVCLPEGIQSDLPRFVALAVQAGKRAVHHAPPNEEALAGLRECPPGGVPWPTVKKIANAFFAASGQPGMTLEQAIRQNWGVELLGPEEIFEPTEWFGGLKAQMPELG